MKCIISLIFFVSCALISKCKFASAMDGRHHLLEESYTTEIEAQKECIESKYYMAWQTPAKDAMITYYVHKCKNNPRKKYLLLREARVACIELKFDRLYYCSRRHYQVDALTVKIMQIKQTLYSSKLLAEASCVTLKKKLKRISLFSSEKWLKQTYVCTIKPNKKYSDMREAKDACVKERNDGKFYCNPSP